MAQASNQTRRVYIHGRKQCSKKGDVPTSKVAAHTDVGDTDSAPIDPPLFLAPSPAPGFLRAAMSVCRSRTRPGTSAMGNGGVSACLISRTDCIVRRIESIVTDGISIVVSDRMCMCTFIKLYVQLQCLQDTFTGVSRYSHKGYTVVTTESGWTFHEDIAKIM